MEFVILAATVVVVSFGVLWGARLLDRGRLAEVADLVKVAFDRAAKSASWQVLAVLIGGGLLFVMTANPSFVLATLGLAVLVLFARAWVHEMLFLMDRTDAELPGRFDKPLWAALLVALPPVGLWLFRAYRQARWPEPADADAVNGAKARVADLA